MAEIWEYKAETVGWHNLQTGSLDALGAKGWNVISMVPAANGYYQVVLKRQVMTTASARRWVRGSNNRNDR